MKMTRSYENMSCEQMARDINSISFVGSRSHIWLPLMYKKHFSKFNRLIIKSIQTSVKFYLNSMVDPYVQTQRNLKNDFIKI